MSKLTDIATYSSVSTSRLKSIYSDLSRQKSSNPAAFHSNVDWWRRTLGAVVEQGLQSDSSDPLVLHANPGLAESLRCEGVGKPLGLAAVITELQDTRALIPLNDFLNSLTSVYDSGSSAYKVVSYAVGKPLWWMLEQLSLVDSEHVESEASLWKKVRGKYVVLGNVEKAADIIEGRLRQRVTSSPADSLYSFDSFRREFGGQGTVLEGVKLSETDLKILVKFLDRDRKVVVSDNNVIKFVDSAASSAARILTGVDRGILELKTGVENMEMQIGEIDKRIAEKTQKIRECLQANHKEIAMTHLKSRKLYEELHKKRLGSLEILHSTLIQVETAAQDVEIMKQYASSTATLRAILAHPSLRRERVDETMDAMAEASAAQREVDDAIRAGVGAAQDEFADEDTLRVELAGLVEEFQEEIRALEEKRRAGLPSVPSGAPADVLQADSSALTVTERKTPVPE